MADNVAVTAGVGPPIATNDVGGVHYQRIKLMDGTPASTTEIRAGNGTAANAMRVAVASDSSALPVTDNGGSFTIDAPVGTPAFVRLSDGTNPITTLPISLAAALPAGTNGIGKLTANTGVTIGAVEIAASQTLATVTNVATIGTSIVPGTSAAHLGKAEDAVHSAGDTGVMALGVRKDTAAATAGNDGDYQPAIFDANGRLHVVESAGTAGDVAHDAADSGKPLKVGGVAAGPFTFPTAVANGDRANHLTDLYGRPQVVIRPDDVKRLGVYYYHSGAMTVAAAADAAAASLGGRLWILNSGSNTLRIRKITFRSQLGSALATPTSPRFTLERCTFTGTPSGGSLTAAKRRSADATATGSIFTSMSGPTITKVADVASFFPIAGATAVGYAPPAEAHFEPGLEDYMDFASGEMLVIRQADAGTASDTRRVTIDFVIEEF